MYYTWVVCVHNFRKRLSVELKDAGKMVAMLEQKNKEWEERCGAQLRDNEKMNATMKEYEAECTALLKVWCWLVDMCG